MLYFRNKKLSITNFNVIRDSLFRQKYIWKTINKIHKIYYYNLKNHTTFGDLAHTLNKLLINKYRTFVYISGKCVSTQNGADGDVKEHKYQFLLWVKQTFFAFSVHLIFSLLCFNCPHCLPTFFHTPIWWPVHLRFHNTV